MTKKPAKSNSSQSPIRLPRRDSVCLILMVLMTVGWFSGGREPVVIFTNSVLGLILFTYWFFTRPKKTKLVPLSKILSIGLIGLVLTIAVSWLWSINRYESTMMAINFTLAASLFIVARDILASKVARQFWIALFTLGAVALAGIGIYYFFVGNYDRIISLFYWPNPLAIYLGVAALLALFGYKSSSNKWYLVATSVLLATAILTYSRAAGICIAIALLAIVLAAKEKKIWLRNIGISLLIAVVLASSLAFVRSKVFHRSSIDLKARIGQAANTSNTSSSDRLNYWRGAGDIFADNMLVGVGAGSFGSIYPRYQRQVISATQDPHNFYAQILGELGMVGVLFLGLIVVGLVGYWRGVFKSRDETKIVFGSALAALLLHVGVDMDFRYPTLLFLASVLLAVFTANQVKSSRQFGKITEIFYTILAIGLVVAVWLSLTNYQLSVTKTQLDAAISPIHGGQDIKSGYEQIESAKFKNPDYLTDTAIYYYMLALNDKTGKTSYDRAELLIRHAITADRYDARHYFLLANIYQIRNQTALANEYFRKTIELDPLNNPQYYAALAESLIKQNNDTEAEKQINTIIALYPDWVITNRSGAINLKSRLAILYNLKAQIHYRRGEKVAALRNLERAINLTPNYKDAQQLRDKIKSGG